MQYVSVLCFGLTTIDTFYERERRRHHSIQNRMSANRLLVDRIYKEMQKLP